MEVTHRVSDDAGIFGGPHFQVLLNNSSSISATGKPARPLAGLLFCFPGFTPGQRIHLLMLLLVFCSALSLLVVVKPPDPGALQDLHVSASRILVLAGELFCSESCKLQDGEKM